MHKHFAKIDLLLYCDTVILGRAAGAAGFIPVLGAMKNPERVSHYLSVIYSLIRQIIIIEVMLEFSHMSRNVYI